MLWQPLAFGCVLLLRLMLALGPEGNALAAFVFLACTGFG